MQQPAAAPSAISQTPNYNPNLILMEPPPSSISLYYPPPHYPYYYYDPPHADQPAALVPPAFEHAGYLPGAYLYSDPNQGGQDWAVVDAARQFGPDPCGLMGACGVAIPSTGTVTPSSGTEHLATTYLSSTAFTDSMFHAYKSGPNKKWPKKIKVVQSAYCEVCKVDCNSKEVLERHKLGKKHKKNLEKLLPQSQAGSLSSTLSRSGALVIGPQEDPNNHLIADGKKTKMKAVETLEDLERKRRKVIEGGAAAEAVQTCTLCNVVCNSETVFQYHLAGQKHIAALRKLGLTLATPV